MQVVSSALPLKGYRFMFLVCCFAERSGRLEELNVFVLIYSLVALQYAFEPYKMISYERRDL